MSGEYKTGSSIEKDELVVIQDGVVGYTVDYIGDDGCMFEAVIVWENERLRNRIIELLNRYGVEDEKSYAKTRGEGCCRCVSCKKNDV